jgi:hypothetical protein
MYAILTKLTCLYFSTIPLQKCGDCRLSLFSHVRKPHIAFLDARSLFLFRERKKDLRVRKWKVALWTSERTYHKLTAHCETALVCCFCLMGGHIRAFYYSVFLLAEFVQHQQRRRISQWPEAASEQNLASKDAAGNVQPLGFSLSRWQYSRATFLNHESLGVQKKRRNPYETGRAHLRVRL